MTASVTLAAPGDDQGIRRLLRTESMPGRVRLTFCREPRFSTGCDVTGSDPRILVARACPDGPVVGVACRSVRHVYLNGRERRIGYLGQLRVSERFRGRWLLSRGFSLLEQIDRTDPLPVYLASIVEGNDQAAGVLVRSPRRSFPTFHEAAAYRTLALRLRRARPPLTDTVAVGTASSDQLPEIVEFLRTAGQRRQLFPVWTEDRLRCLEPLGLSPSDIRVARRNGSIVGTLALWDQSAFKQTIVAGYSGWLKAAAPLLPRAGTELRSAYAAFVCVAGDDTAVFNQLLSDVYRLARARGFDYLLIGLDARDPLLPVAERYSHVSYPSRLYLARWAKGDCEDAPLDARPAYVDVASL
jgi:hypothetical protein